MTRIDDQFLQEFLPWLQRLLAFAAVFVSSL